MFGAVRRQRAAQGQLTRFLAKPHSELVLDSGLVSDVKSEYDLLLLCMHVPTVKTNLHNTQNMERLSMTSVGMRSLQDTLN